VAFPLIPKLHPPTGGAVRIDGSLDGARSQPTWIWRGGHLSVSTRGGWRIGV